MTPNMQMNPKKEKKVPKESKNKNDIVEQELFPKILVKKKTENPEPNGIEEEQKPCIT